jgi:predicted dienelactone hydrolase
MERLYSSISVVLLASSLVACGGKSVPRAPNACTPDSAGDPWDFATATAPGEYAVGTMEVTLVDSTRTTIAHGTYAGAPDRTLLVTIWYPAVTAGADVVAAPGGPFPIVGYSHGFSSNRRENPLLASHLASHGYIVASPSFPSSNIQAEGGPTSAELDKQPGDISFVLDAVIGYGTTPAHPLFGAVDSERIAAAGLSMGGGTTLLLTFHPTLRDPRIDVAVGLAPVAALFGEAFYATVQTPLMVIHGDADAILDYRYHALAVRDRAGSPSTLLTLDRGTHTGFTAISLVFEDAEGYEHIDALGCYGLEQFGGSGGGPGPDLYTILGGAEAGLVIPPPGAEFCPDPLGVGMRPSRQLEITNAAVLSFFDAYLSSDAVTRGRACAFSEGAVAASSDVSISRH